MAFERWFEWLSKHWVLIGGLLTLILVSIPQVLLHLRQEKRKAKEVEARRQRLIREADNLCKRAKRLLLLPPNIWPQSEREKDQALYQDVEEENPEKMLCTATENYSEAIGLTKNKREECELWLKIGHCYELLKWLPEAEEAYHKAVRSYPKHPTARRKLAEVQYGLLKDQEALSNLKQHLQINPSDKDARRLLEQWRANTQY